MALDTMIVPGFGIGNYYGSAITVGLTQTSTYTISTGLYAIANGMATGVQACYVDTSVTATYTVQTGAGNNTWMMSDGASATLINTTTSVTIRLIQFK